MAYEHGEHERAAILNEAFAQGGVIERVAQAGLAEPAELAPSDVADIILPPRVTGEPLEPRWHLVANARDEIKDAASVLQDGVFLLAQRLDMRRETAFSNIDIARIDSASAVWVVEGGANRTSVVRRSLAEDAMRHFYGDNVTTKQLFQFGSDCRIPWVLADGRSNPEYAVAQEIAADLLTGDDYLTEFELNLASAQQNGFEVILDQYDTFAQRVVRMQRADSPELIHIKPLLLEHGGLENGFTAVDHFTGGLADNQLVIATNGQYRPKDETQADRWTQRHGLDMLPPVAIGDEPGYSVQHDGRNIVTASRAPIVYVNEAVVLHRLINE